MLRASTAMGIIMYLIAACTQAGLQCWESAEIK